MIIRCLRAPAIAAALSTAAFMAGCGGPPAQPQMAPPKVQVATVGEQQINPYQQFIGRVRAVEDATIYARVSGYLKKTSFKEGQMVQQGDVLFTLDQEEYQIAVERAEAGMKVAEAEKTAAERNFKRQEDLRKKGVIAEKDYDEALNRRDQATASVAEALAELNSAKYDLSQTELKAPFTGRVGRALVSIGDNITSQEALTTIVTVDPMHVYMDISERAVAEFNERFDDERKRQNQINHSQLKLVLPSGTEYSEIGQFDFFDNRINDRTGALRARAVFKNVNNLLTDGQYVTVQIERTETISAKLVPMASIQQDQLGAYVLAVGENNIVLQKRVELGEQFGVDRAVHSGVEIGDRIIVEGIMKSRPGKPVNPVQRQSAPGDSQAVPAPATEPVKLPQIDDAPAADAPQAEGA
jgi:membrane fusion protein (multidrug efflux system)